MKVFDHYSGFEGENELVVQWRLGGSPRCVVRGWEGFFAELMDGFPPPLEGWRGIALHHHLDTGWNEAPEWRDPELVNTLEVLREARASVTSNDVVSFAESLLFVVQRAVVEGGEVVWSLK